MNIPNVTSLGTMGITGNYSGAIEGCCDQPKEVLVKERINNINQQMTGVADAFIKYDNTERDLCPERGKVLFAQHGPPTGEMGTVVEYNLETGKPTYFACGNEEGVVDCKAEWNDQGQLVNMAQVRNLGDHVETVSIKHDSDKGIIYYEEHYTPFIQQ